MKDPNSTSTYMSENGQIFIPREGKFIIKIEIDLTWLHKLIRHLLHKEITSST